MLMLGVYKDVAAACIRKAQAREKRRTETEAVIKPDEEDFMSALADAVKDLPISEKQPELLAEPK
jgi:hypothetical protein